MHSCTHSLLHIAALLISKILLIPEQTKLGAPLQKELLFSIVLLFLPEEAGLRICSLHQCSLFPSDFFPFITAQNWLIKSLIGSSPPHQNGLKLKLDSP